MKGNYITLFAFLVGLVAFSPLYSQMEKYHVDGDMKDGFTDMSNAFVIVYSGGQKVKRIDASSSGKFEFDLEFGKDYVLEFRKQYYATKKVDILLGAVTAEMIDIGCRPGPVQVTMIKKVDGIDYSVLDKPVGKIFFEPESKCFDWDADYTLRVMEKLEQLTDEMEQKQETYDKSRNAGSKALSKGDFAAAGAAIAAAKAVFPNDPEILKMEEDLEKAKKAAADAEAAAKLAEENKKKEAEEKAKRAEYDKKMAEGDKAMKGDDFEGAKVAYAAAGSIIPDATAHQTKLQIVEDTKAKREKEAADAAAAKAAEEEAEKKAEEEAAVAKAAEQEAKKKAEEEAKVKEPKKEEPKKEEPKKSSPKPAVKAPAPKAPTPAPKKAVVSAGVGAAAVAVAKPKKSEIHKDAKQVKPKSKNADIHAALDAAAMKQNPTTTSVHEHHDWNIHDPGVHQEIAKEYPEGVTEEVYMQGKKQITERVVVKDGKGDIFMKILHPWGGVFYFKNMSTPISAIEFDLFTTVKDENGKVIPPYHIDRQGDH